ncbi:unnamed protein product, partial [Darwinula stevensoni]
MSLVYIQPKDGQYREKKKERQIIPWGPATLLSGVGGDGCKLEIDSLVEVTLEGDVCYGVIKWIGQAPEDADPSLRRKVLAGLEMEEEMETLTDGTLNGKRYFSCPPLKGLFLPLTKCRKDQRFFEKSSALDGIHALSPAGCEVDREEVVRGAIEPCTDLRVMCSRYRGIQGHLNSCYLDATLFAMFSFSSAFDGILFRPREDADIPQYEAVQGVLRDEIVNPLRRNLYVKASHVMKLRTLLDRLSTVAGLTSEEKDPEEFLQSLLAQTLNTEPLIKLANGQKSFLYQLIPDKDERLVLPTVQQLFDQSCLGTSIKFLEVPPCLIIQLPRCGKQYKMYPRIQPSLVLDITDILENVPRSCHCCGHVAEEDSNSLPVPRAHMELFAVVCIHTSHYVAFVKGGSGADAPWCFFDSMADREGGETGHNIPEVVEHSDIAYWLSDSCTQQVLSVKEDKRLPEHVRRLLCDGYMCFYQSHDVLMYRDIKEEPYKKVY